MLAPNTILQGRYQIVRQLGRGGMGTVYEARALRLNTTVALKETHFTDERLRRQFEREAQLLAKLRHTALPRVIDHFDEPEGLYLVMDFVEGDDLWEMLRKRGTPFPVADVIAWTGQLLDALQYLHTQQPPVIHRDIKPQNLKLTEDGRVILLDFGLAKGMSEGATNLMSSRTVMGFSLPYAPLEQILQIDENSREQLSVLNSEEVERIRHAGTSYRSDLYSVGATLLHLLTAKVPVTSPTRAISIWSNRPDPLEDALAQGVAESLRPFIRRSMTLDPDQRFASAAEMREALRGATAGALAGTVLTPTVLDTAASELKTQPLSDSQRAASKPTSKPDAIHDPMHDSATLLSPQTVKSRRGGDKRRGLLTAGVVLVIVAIAAGSVMFLLPSKISSLSTRSNTNTTPTQEPTVQPSASPTAEVVEEPPTNNSSGANVRHTPATPTPHPSATPTPHVVAQPTPQPTPPPRPTPPTVENTNEGEGVQDKDIDERIKELQRRKAALVLTQGPFSPEVRRIDRVLQNLRRRQRRQ